MLLAQSAELSGFVLDRNKASIVGARLELRSRETGFRFRTVTNQDGLYSFTALKPGAYDAIVQAEAFRTFTQDIVLDVGDRAGLDFSLELIVVNTSVQVTAESATNTAPSSLDGAVETIVDRTFVANMPLNGRSFQSLLYMTPGVLPTVPIGENPGQFVVNGQRNNANYFTIDGVSANFSTAPVRTYGQAASGSIPAVNALGGTNGLVSVDGMQEFRIQSSSYAPEYGRVPGGQISIVTKSGTNTFHGTAFEYLRHDIFDARNWFNTVPQPKPPLRQNNFGGTFGGPVRKNRTFFFVSYEGLRLEQPQIETAFVVTAEAPVQAAPIALSNVIAFPLPTGPVNQDGIGALQTVPYSDSSRFDATSGRVDHSIRSATIFGRYNHSPSSQIQQPLIQVSEIRNRIDTATGGATVLLGPDKVNDFRANWSRSEIRSEDRPVSVFGPAAPPSSGSFSAVGVSQSGALSVETDELGNLLINGTLSRNIQQQINLIDIFSMTAGVHLLKFGVDYRRMQPTNYRSSNTMVSSPLPITGGAGTISFTGDGLTLDAPGIAGGAGTISFTGDGSTLHAPGIEDIAEGAGTIPLTGSDPITARLHNLSLFAQDTWKVSRDLTVTYGLRWEINTPPKSADNGRPLYAMTGFFDSRAIEFKPGRLWKTQLSNFAPRVGATWRMGQNTVMRGGFGLFYDLGYGARSTPLAAPAPSGTQSTASLYNQTLIAADPHLRLPKTYEWNVALEQTFGSHQSLTATYVGAWGTDLIRRDSVILPSTLLAQQNNLTWITYNSGYSHYNALQLRYLRRLSRGLQALVSYTLSESMDTVSSDNGILGGSTGSLAKSVNELTALAPPIAPSDFDARHLFSSAISWQLPAHRNFAHGLLKDWTLDGIVRAQSALPINVTYSRRVAGVASYVQADVVAGQPSWIPDANQPRGQVLNPAAFAAPTTWSGNFPRNSLRAFPFSQTDAALRRRFRLSERVTLDVRAEYFNIFNHPNFGSPSGLWGATEIPLSSFGKVPIGNTWNVALGGVQSGAQAAIYAPGGPRSAQFTVRLGF